MWNKDPHRELIQQLKLQAHELRGLNQRLKDEAVAHEAAMTFALVMNFHKNIDALREQRIVNEAMIALAHKAVRDMEQE